MEKQWWEKKANKATTGSTTLGKDVESLGKNISLSINPKNKALPLLLSAAGIVIKETGKFGARGLYNVVNDLWGGGVYDDGE